MRQYIVGIDLGTTHTVVAFARLSPIKARGKTAKQNGIELFQIEQLVGPGQVAALPLLPSVRYHAGANEFAAGALQLPWAAGEGKGGETDSDTPASVVIGQWARTLGAQVPGRLVTSAKSWLSHPAVDRLAPILPWGASAEVPKVSPVEASASYLAYVRDAWNAQHPQHPLAQQDLVLTVPASFDEAARALTLSAAHQAGLPQLRLLEEPQAVFYDWLWRHRSNLKDELAPSRLVLVCDVGGGTTDLSLFEVAWQDDLPQLTRIGVGQHLMLGGDNMDLALAHLVESRLTSTPGAPPTRLSASQLAQLVERCRHAKEQLLAANAPAQVQVTLLGGGARLIGGSRSATLTRQDVAQQIVDGFFPQVDASAQATQSRSGLVAFGLPYARDAAITRHLADFLRQHAHARPDTLLLNGGVFRSGQLAERLQQTLADWRGEPLHLLHNDNPDVAVARGAVAYALAQQGLAPVIGGGSARSYFLVLEEASGPGRAPSGICLLPRGTEPGQEVRLSGRTFSLRLGQPVRFHLVTSTADLADKAQPEAGDLVTLAHGQFEPLPPIAMVIKATNATSTGVISQFDLKNIPVQLAVALTEVGTLEMHCVSLTDANQRWRLEFDLRHVDTGASPAQPDRLAAARLAQAIEHIDRIFGPGAKPVAAKEVKQLRAQLEHTLGAREQWATPDLRQLFDALWARQRARRRSVEHERVWLNLAGYCLRPGLGDPLDGWRVAQLWTQYPSGVQFANDKQVCAEWWTLWRRVAGGLAAPEQLELLNGFAYNLQRNEHGVTPDTTPPVKGSDDDMLRLGAALERIPADYKTEIGDWLLKRLHKSLAKSRATVSGHHSTQASASSDALHLWALGRIGTRQPFYGSPHDVAAIEVATAWLGALLLLDWKKLEPAAFAATHLARVTDDRARDLDPVLREQIATRLTAIHAPAAWVDMVRQRVELDVATERRMLGESLPPGLKLIG
ncbi:MAG: hsp70 family protein [Rhodoferax sp.]|uniref:Hsp70 family protein n=1 Tax=Rhodoferax sp. TaxID=50421 RepID=UPI002630A758|nr:Hsp70 family protein [Rhodoferax sp.]MDD2879916.1 hsp70 family protein [Rhodoferax sp.]